MESVTGIMYVGIMLVGEELLPNSTDSRDVRTVEHQGSCLN
jgi:hypothetical protein